MFGIVPYLGNYLIGNFSNIRLSQFKEYLYICDNRTYEFENTLTVLLIEVVQSVPYFVDIQNLLCNEGKMQHNVEKVFVASYVSGIKHITFLPMSPAC